MLALVQRGSLVAAALFFALAAPAAAQDSSSSGNETKSETTSESTAATEDHSLDNLQKILEGMGYEAKKLEYSLQIDNNAGYYVNFTLSEDGKILYCYLTSDTYTAEQSAKLNLIELLNSNTINRAYFSTSVEDGKTYLYLNVNMPVSSISAVELRYAIDALGKVQARTEELRSAAK